MLVFSVRRSRLFQLTRLQHLSVDIVDFYGHLPHNTTAAIVRKYFHLSQPNDVLWRPCDLVERISSRPITALAQRWDWALVSTRFGDHFLNVIFFYFLG